MKIPGRTAFPLILSVCIAALALLGACATQPPVNPEDLSTGEVFQRAQDAADQGDYSLAMRYYTLFQQKHPEDREHGAWASYEIAFLYHKMGKNDTALALLTTLLDEYAKEGNALPPAPRILAEKLKARLQQSPLKTS